MIAIDISRTLTRSVLFASVIALLLLGAQSVHSYGDKAKNEEMRKAFEEKNFQRFLSLVKPFAEAGDSNAQLHLCLLHWHGVGTDEDSKTAIDWCGKAASEDSNAEKIIQILSSIAFPEGIATPLNKTPALEQLTAKAESGDSNAQWLMYRVHELRLVEFPKKDRDATEKWLQAAIDQNHPKALVESVKGIFASTLQTDPASRKKFIDYMTRAANQGNTEAMRRLGFFYLPNEYGTEPPHKDYEEATKWFRLAAVNGYISLTGARLLRNKKNPVRDYDEGLKWLILSADAGDMSAQVELADIYQKGNEIPRNTELANELLKKALSFKYADTYFEDFATAHYKLGFFFQYNDDGKRDYIRAWEHYKKIVNHKHADMPVSRLVSWYGVKVRNIVGLAKYQLGNLYADSLGQQKDENEALRWFSEAAEMSEPRAIRWRQYYDAKSSVNSDILRSIQQHLARLGYKPGPADGTFGIKFFGAIKAFQCSSSVDSQYPRSYRDVEAHPRGD